MKPYIKEGNQAFAAGNFEKAIELYRKCSGLPPKLMESIDYNIKLSQWHLSKTFFNNDNAVFLYHKIVFGIITTQHTLLIAEAISRRLKYHGYGVYIYLEAPKDYVHNYYFILCPQIFDSLPPGEKRICFQLEQSISDRWFDDRYLSILENSLLVVDYSLQNIRFLKSKGISYPMVHYLPLGGLTGLIDQKIDKDIDVLFYGDSLSCPRRQRLLDVLKAHFKVEIANDTFGIEIREKIRRAKVVINLHYYAESLLEAPRLMECLSLGTMVVSERSKDSHDYDLMNDCIVYFETDSLENMILAVEDSIENNIEPELIEKTVAKLEDRFNFMLDRLLIASNILSVDKCDEMIVDIPMLTDGICLSMPETIDRRDLFLAEQKNDIFIFDGIRKSPGWIGCGLSYKVLAKSALHHNLESMMVMEDDVLLPPNFNDTIAIVRKYLNTMTTPWDLFSGLIANLHSDTEILNVEDFEGIKFVTINKMTSTVCNIYNKSFFEKIVEWDPKIENSTSNTIDRFIESFPDLRVVTTVPFLVGHREDVFSVLWNFQNTQYLDMIQRSNILLRKKIDAYCTGHTV